MTYDMYKRMCVIQTVYRHMIGEKELDDILVWQSIQSAYKRKTKVESKEKFKDKYQCFISDSMNIIYDSGL